MAGGDGRADRLLTLTGDRRNFGDGQPRPLARIG